MRNVYCHVVIAVDQSRAFRIFHSAFYFPHLLTPVVDCKYVTFLYFIALRNDFICILKAEDDTFSWLEMSMTSHQAYIQYYIVHLKFWYYCYC